MDRDTIWGHVDTERTALADLLETLPDDAWRVPSLCDAWTVRDVAAHLCFSQARVRDLGGPAIRSERHVSRRAAGRPCRSSVARTRRRTCARRIAQCWWKATST